MQVQVHDSRDAGADDRFTAHLYLREDLTSVSAVEVDIETYGPDEHSARLRMTDAVRGLAERLLASTQ